jgi:hypothetical protein
LKGQLWLVIFSFMVPPLSANSGENSDIWFPVRTHNPFLQVYGLPPFQAGTLVGDGEFRYNIGLDIANHADAGQSDTESIVIDGESYYLTVSFRHGLTHWLEVGFDLPLVAHSSGFLDGPIESWHDFWGMSNSKRRGPNNQLQFNYDNQMSGNYELTSRPSGIGDLQLTAAVPLVKANAQGDLAFSVRSSVKLPSGNDDKLLGSGAVDVSLGIYASNVAIFSGRDLRYSGFAGVLLPGDGDLFPDLQRSSVAFGGAAAAWQWTNKFSIVGQLYAQDSYLNSDLDELGGSSVQLTLGGIYRLPAKRMSLAFAIVEDVFSDATTDFALHFGVRGYGGK